MAGVLEQLIRPQKRAVVYRNPKALELQTAKEILAEVFRVRLSEVDEMIQNRFEVAGKDDMVSEKKWVVAAGVLAVRVRLFQAYHFSCVYLDPAFPGQLYENGVQVCKSHPCASPQSAPLHLAAAIGEYPQDTISSK